MKLISKPIGSWTGVHTNKSSNYFSVVLGLNITHIYTGYGYKKEDFSIWIEDCPSITSDKEVFKLIYDFGLIEKCVKSLCEIYFEQGKNTGKTDLQNQFKELMGIYTATDGNF